MFEFLLSYSLCVPYAFNSQSDDGNDQKSLSVERTFTVTNSRISLFVILEELSQFLSKELKNRMTSVRNIDILISQAKTICLKIKTDKFHVKTRSKTGPPVFKETDIFEISQKLLANELPDSIRLLGLKASSFTPTEKIKTLDNYFTPNNLEKITCPICLININEMNESTRMNHVNSCLDKSAE
jgi:hypothetical protein